MNANYEPKASITVKNWLADAQVQLHQADISSTRLDAELLLLRALGKQKTWLITHIEHKISSAQTEVAREFLARRLKREPIAYIVEEKEFYRRTFFVNKEVLIPRPETENLIEMFRQLRPQAMQSVIDVGTGSGCIGVTLKAEFPYLRIMLSDVSEKALMIAKRNIQRYALDDVEYYESNLLSAWLQVKSKPQVDYIVANLPYVDRSWDISPETIYEPDLALFANDDGLELIKELIIQAKQVLSPQGYLLLEADTRQLDTIANFAQLHSFNEIARQAFCIVLQKAI